MKRASGRQRDARSALARSPARVHRLGLQRRVAVLLRDVGVDRFGGRVQQIAARARSTGPSATTFSCTGSSDQRARRRSNRRTFQSGIAFAVREPAAEEAVAPRHRVRRGGGRAARERAANRRGELAARRARRRRGTAPSRASPAPTANCFCGPKPRHACSITRAPERCASATVSSRLPESTTTISAANGADARHSASSSAASRVITMSDRGSGSDMRRSADRTRAAVYMFDADERRLLVVRPSSLGDIVHTLALVADVDAHAPGTAIDWVAEEAFVAARRARPARAARRFRSRCGAGAARRSRRATWREFARVPRRRCARERYDAILDLQEQVKGALIARMAQRRAARLRPRERARAARDAGSTTCITRSPRDQHFVDAGARARGRGARLRGRRARRAGTSRRRRARPRMPARPVRARAPRDEPRRQAVARGALARAARALRAGGLRRAAAVGQRRRGAAQRARSRATRRNAIVPPRLSLPELAALARAARRSSSASTPGSRISPRRSARRRSALFTATDPALAGVARAGPHARDLGGNGSVPVARRRASRRAGARAARRAALLMPMRALHAAVVARAAVAAAAPVVARPPRARLPRAHRRALRPLRDDAPPRDGRALDPRGVARRDARRRAAGRAPAARASRTRRSLLTHMTATGREAGARALRRPRRAGVAALRRAVRRARVPRALPPARRAADGDRAVAEPRRAPARDARRAAVPRQRAAVGALGARLSRGSRR